MHDREKALLRRSYYDTRNGQKYFIIDKRDGDIKTRTEYTHNIKVSFVNLLLQFCRIFMICPNSLFACMSLEMQTLGC